MPTISSMFMGDLNLEQIREQMTEFAAQAENAENRLSILATLKLFETMVGVQNDFPKHPKDVEEGKAQSATIYLTVQAVARALGTFASWQGYSLGQTADMIRTMATQIAVAADKFAEETEKFAEELSRKKAEESGVTFFEQTCLHCGRPNNATWALEGTRERPSPGDVTMCEECGGWSFFDDELKLRKPTEEEAKEMANDPDIQRATAAFEIAQKLGIVGKHRTKH
jgi:hypothetical protein